MKFNTISFLLLVFLLFPAVSSAQSSYDWGDWGDWADEDWSDWRGVDRDELDDDPVEEFPIPILFAVDYENIIPDFGDPRGGGSREHEGQDMRAPKGTPVVSPTEAIVIRTGDGSSSGLYVYTANPGGETFRYMHLDSVADIETGDELEAGDLIGTVGDTGNAPDGVYHLHFEVRDDDNDPTDPYERMTDTFSLKEKASFLENIIDTVDEDEDDYAEFLVESFPAFFKEVITKGYDLPKEIEEALEGSEVEEETTSELKLLEVLNKIPLVLQDDLRLGEQSAMVSLLQIYIIYTDEGTARDNLRAAGPTGYYGSITTGAVEALQAELDVPQTGQYDAATRKALLNRSPELNVN